MKIQLYLALPICLFSASLFSQNFGKLQIKNLPTPNFQVASPSGSCSAGTLKVGQHIGQSNDVSLDTIYLCFGDQVKRIKISKTRRVGI